MVRIAEIHDDSIATALGLEVGSRILRINGAAVRDGIDFRFREVDEVLELEVAPAEGGPAILYEIRKEAGESLGVVPAPDPIRQCANKCVFCFVDGNPGAARRPLHLKDDDFRLSFTYGSYVTLTNLGPRGFQRLIDQRLSPLYVSVHATEPAVRRALLGVPLGGNIVEQLAQLTGAGIEVHTQVVLCPGWNDGVHLDRTMDDLWALGPRVLSLSVVPVGLTRYNLGRPIRLLEREEAAAAIDQVDAARLRAQPVRGVGWVYAADELFFLADRPLPGASYYDDWPLTENGVGAVRRFLDDFQRQVNALPRLEGQRIGLVTGTRMAPLLAPLARQVEAATGATTAVIAVANSMYGPTVTTAGLLPGNDIARAVLDRAALDVVLLPAEALNDDGQFVDDLTLGALRQTLAPRRLVPAHELTAGLRQS